MFGSMFLNEKRNNAARDYGKYDCSGAGACKRELLNSYIKETYKT
jgi:hypothetical protein